jgi:hypothetical protein
MEHILKHPVKWQGSFFYPGLIGKSDILIDSGIIFAIIKKRKKEIKITGRDFVVQKVSGSFNGHFRFDDEYGGMRLFRQFKLVPEQPKLKRRANSKPVSACGK